MGEKKDDHHILEVGASIALDCVPVVGTGKSAVELVEGKDLVTGEKINRWILAGGLLLSLVPFGKAAFKAARAAIKERKAISLATRTAYGAASKKEAAQRLEKVLDHMPHAASNTAQNRYQYELLRKQYRMQEGALSAAEKEVIGNVGGHSFPKHSLSSNSVLHSTGEFRSQMGHDYGRFGRDITKEVEVNGFKFQKIVGQEQLLVNAGEEVFGLQVFAKDLPLRVGGSKQFGMGSREGFFEYIKTFLKDPKTQVVPLKNGRVAYVNAEKKVVLYEPLNHAFEPTIYQYKNLSPEVQSAMAKAFQH